MTRCTFFCAVAAALAISASAGAATVYDDHFDTGDLNDPTRGGKWIFETSPTAAHNKISSNATPKLLVTSPIGPLYPGQTGTIAATHFLGEFGGDDQIRLHLALGPNVGTFRIAFDAYLLRTWDGWDPTFGGPDTFGYGYNDSVLFQSTFSDGFGEQDFCPGGQPGSKCAAGTGSDFNQKDRLGFNVELDPVPIVDKPKKGDPMSLVYHFDSGPVAYNGSEIDLFFFSRGLQLHKDDIPDKPVIDESWGLDNVAVDITTIPEPRLPLLLLSGLIMLAGVQRFARLRGKRT